MAFFFFQAEDGIRDIGVTGVQTCALPILATCTDEVFELRRLGLTSDRVSVVPCGVDTSVFTPRGPVAPRSERPRLLVLGRLVERKGQDDARSEEHTSELQSRQYLVCRLLLEKKNR